MKDRGKNKINFMKGTVSVFLLFLAFLTFNLTASTHSFQLDESDSVAVKGYHSDLHLNVTSGDYHHNPFELPVEPTPEPNDSEEDTDGNDNLDEDSKWSKSSSISSNLLSCILDSNSSRQTIKQLEQSLANQRRISLFVLHHSWKNFIS